MWLGKLTALDMTPLGWLGGKTSTQTINLWANSADDKLMIFFLFFPENRMQHFMQIVFNGDNLHEMSMPVPWET